MERTPKRMPEQYREGYEKWLRQSALARGLMRLAVMKDDFEASVAGAFVGPKLQQRIQNFEGDPGAIASITGSLAGTATQVAMGGAVLRALAPMVQGAAQAGRIPGLAQAVGRVQQASPLAQEVLRDMAIGPMIEGMRALGGHDVTMKDVLRSMAITGGAGLGAIGGRTMTQGASQLATRAAMTAGATAGGLAGAVPFAGMEGSGTEAIVTGLAMGLLYPAHGQAQLNLPGRGVGDVSPGAATPAPTPSPTPAHPSSPEGEGYSVVPIRRPAREMPTEATEFINSRRNPQRKQYAQKYAEWLAGGEQGPMPEAEGITTRAGREIRERIDEIIGAAEGPAQLPLPVDMDDIVPKAPGQTGAGRTVSSTPEPQMRIIVDPPSAETIAQQGGAAATVDMVTGQGGVPLFRPIQEVVGDGQSLIDMNGLKLPRALRRQLTEIDVQIKSLNAEAQKILRRAGVNDPSDLSPQGQKQYAEVLEQLREMDGRRNALRPAVLAELESNGTLGRVVSNQIDNEIAQDIAAIEGPQRPAHIEHMETARPWETEVRTGDVIEGLSPEELQLNPNVFHDQEDSILGFATKIDAPGQETMEVFRTAEARHLDLVEAAPDAMEAMRGRTPNYLNVVFTSMRDLFGEDVAKQVRDAKHASQVFNSQWGNVLDDILKPFKGLRGAKSRVRIGKLLDGTPVEGVTDAERLAARELREKFFDPLFKEFDIDPDRFLQDYLPRLRAGRDLSTELPAEEWTRIKFFAEEMRSAIDGPEDRLWDVLDVTTRYLRAGSKNKFMEPARLAVEPAVAQMDPHRRMAFETWFGQLMGRRTVDEMFLDKTLDATVGKVVRQFGGTFSDRPSQELSLAVTQLVHLGTIGFNAFSIVKNLTQQIHTMAQSGVGYWAKAHRALRTQSGKELLKYNWVGQHRVYLEGMELQRTAMDRILGPVSDLAFRGYQWADQSNVNTAYLAAVLKDLDQGKSLAHAINTGNYTAMLTQFGYGVDSPALFRTPVGRLIGALQSYPVNFARMLYAQGTTGHKAEAIRTVVGLAAGAWLLEKTTKMDFSSITPWETLQGHPAWAALRGEFSVPVQTGISLVDTGTKWLDGLVNNRDPQIVEEAFDNLKENLKTYVPTRTQYRRLARFIDRVANDWQELDEQGRPLYGISKGEAIRAIFGPTKEADLRFNIRRKYEDALMREVDPDRFGLLQKARTLPQTLLMGDAAYVRNHLRGQADRIGLDGKKLHDESVARVRQYYYGDGRNGFWPAVYRNDTEEARRTGEVLKRLEVTTPMLISAGESRGVDGSLLRRGVSIFGYVGMPPARTPIPDVIRSRPDLSLQTGRVPIPSIQTTRPAMPSL